MKIQGTIQAVSQKDKRYAVRINDVWYSAFGICPVRKESFVELEFEKNGEFNNIKDIKEIEMHMGAKVETKVEEKPLMPDKRPLKQVYMPRSMYVSYAKDIFVALINNKTDADARTEFQTMEIATNLVKQADRSFE